MNLLNHKSLAACAFALLSIFTACDNAQNIGGNLVQGDSAVDIYTDFTITGQSVPNPSVQARTITQLLGSFTAEEYGFFSSEFVAQILPATKLSPSITSENIDSLMLTFYVPKNAIVGDSVTPMGLEVYQLNKQLKAPLFSGDFDVSKYYDPADQLASKIYSLNTVAASDSLKKLSYRTIDIRLSDQLANKFFDIYKADPQNYYSNFLREFPGIYVKNTYGSGRLVGISNTTISLFYHTTSTDDDGNPVIKRHEGIYYAVTPEMIVNNIFSFDMSSALQTMISQGEHLIIAPVGQDVEVNFPLPALIEKYRTQAGALSVVNQLSLKIPAEAVTNDYGIQPPTNVLFVLKSKKDEFFYKNQVPDNTRSFIATYDSATKSYSIAGMRNYILDMIDKNKDVAIEDLTPDDYIFTLTPVSVVTETNSAGYGSTTSVVTAVNPYVGTPVMANLDLSQAEIKFVFSKLTIL